MNKLLNMFKQNSNPNSFNDIALKGNIQYFI